MKRIVTQKSAKNALLYIFLLLGGAVSVMPMIYMISTSLKPNGALYEFPPHFLPTAENITVENYAYIFGQEKFYRNFLNSAFVALATVLIHKNRRRIIAVVNRKFKPP